MMGQLTSTQMEQMRQQLIVPLAVSDILHHDIHVEPDMQYGLHMALSEADPDSALLAIAICAQDLAKQVIQQLPIAAALEAQTSEILTHYGPRWVRNNVNAPISTAHYEEILETVPEDLESLADLLDALQADLNDEFSNITSLAQILSIQARAHMEIADFVLAEIAYEKQSMGKSRQTPNFGYNTDIEENSETPAQNEQSFAGDNIIVFPG
jgi:hypothetical protein